VLEATVYLHSKEIGTSLPSPSSPLPCSVYKSLTPSHAYIHHLRLFNCAYREKVLITVHRDLKPENVLYKTQSHHSPIVIADFGIAKHLEYDLPDTTTISPSSTISNSSSPQTLVDKEGKKDGEEKQEGKEKEEEEPREGGVDSFAGSFGYTAPEVLLGLRHGLKVDCWSIGYVPFPPPSSLVTPVYRPSSSLPGGVC
jgi:serine/threonine protein kinase